MWEDLRQDIDNGDMEECGEEGIKGNQDRTMIMSLLKCVAKIWGDLRQVNDKIDMGMCGKE